MHSESARHRQGIMTLRSLLLMFTGGLILTLLGISVVVSFDRFHEYISHQLEGHTRDAATAVGLSLSNAIDARDPVATGRLIDAVFDSGNYLVVEFVDHQGEPVVHRSQSLEDVPVPAWFLNLVSLPQPRAEADVMQGWQRLGRVRVVAHPGQAYADLWKTAWGLILGASIAGGAALVVLFWLLTRILRPLRALEQQAQAIGRRDFRGRVRIRSTRELNQVVAAINRMTGDLEQLFTGQARLVQHLRSLNNEDSLTGLDSRSAFDRRLRVMVESDDSAPGTLMLIHIAGFADYNRLVGRQPADQLLVRVAEVVRAFLTDHGGGFGGRRTGAEFAVFMPGGSPTDGLFWGRELVAELDTVCAGSSEKGVELMVHGGVASVTREDSVSGLFSACDEALRKAEAAGISGCEGSDPGLPHHYGAEVWRSHITAALDQGRIALWQQPVVSPDDVTTLWHQVSARLQVEDIWVRDSVFVPIAERFGLMARLDLSMTDLTLARLQQDPAATLGLSLGTSSVADPDFREQLLQRLAAVECRHRLWVGIAEQSVHYHRAGTHRLVTSLRRLGVAVVVDRFGIGGVPFSYIRNLPVQALRIDQSFIHDIERQADNRFYLESMVTIAHSRGVRVLATGVETSAEWQEVRAMGVDGAMGAHLGRAVPLE